MHEWALAEAVIAAASQIAKKERLREVSEVRIKVGELQQIELDILEFALSELKLENLRDAKFRIDVVKAKLKCRVCEFEWFFGEEKLDESMAEAIHFIPEVAHAYIKCPRCSSADFEFLEGRGVWLETVKGVK
ncbi:MAG: hydrogenase nickel incorporation protein HypA [Candidatus Bathycorpusculaceae bacterium]